MFRSVDWGFAAQDAASFAARFAFDAAFFAQVLELIQKRARDDGRSWLEDGVLHVDCIDETLVSGAVEHFEVAHYVTSARPHFGIALDPRELWRASPGRISQVRMNDAKDLGHVNLSLAARSWRFQAA